MNLLGIAVLSAVVSLLAYDGRMRRDVSRALSIVFLAAAVELLLTLSAGLPPLSALPDAIPGTSLTEETAADAFSDGVASYVCETFDLAPGGVSVSLVGFDFPTMHAEKIKVLLSGNARFADTHAIREAVEKAGLGICEVEIEIG